MKTIEIKPDHNTWNNLKYAFASQCYLKCYTCHILIDFG